MSDPRDTGPSEPGSAGAQSGTPDVGQPRKPRIEVLQRGPAADPGPSYTQDRNTAGINAAGTAAPGASPARSTWTASQPRQAETASGGGRRGLLRSPTTLLILLACIVIAGFLLYTYLSSERGVDASDKGTQLSSADADLLGDPQTESDAATTREPGEPSAAASLDDGVVPEPEPAASPEPRPAPPRAAAPEGQPAVADRPEVSPAPESEAADDDSGASVTVRAFYSALSAGDGASAAQLVIPAKRRSGPLSAGALTRYYSSFSRPLRLRSVIPVDDNTVRVAYDYVLADGRVCRGQAAVDVVQRDGRSLVSGIRTRGPC
ncbi:MAG TPA: hypothetical protein VF782_00610 [Allosphingosinicella sp.]|jgi:hypothetical protein